MKRPIGVTLSAIALGFAAAFALLISAMFTLGVVILRNAKLPTPQTPGVPAATGFAIALAFSFFFAIACAWITLTLIGILRLRSWARYSILVIGGFLVFIAVCSIFGLALAATVVPAQPNVPVSTMHTILIVQGLFYSALAALGAWWLVFFNLRSTKAYFLPAYAGGYSEGFPTDPALIRPPGRFARVPTSIIVLACILLFSSACCATWALASLPTFLFGFTLTGPAVHLLFLTYALAMALIGWGLLRLDNRARLALYGLSAFGALNFAVMFTPWGKARYLVYQHLLNSRVGLPTSPALDPTSTPFIVAAVLFCLIFYGIQLWILERHRRAFLSPPPPPDL